jgi:transglutaminase-like putative cysteine protease
MRYQVSHTTVYEYNEPVSLCQNLVHLRPRTVPGQRCLSTSLDIDPVPGAVSDRIDYFGNPATFFSIQEPHRQLTLTANHQVEAQTGPTLEPDRSPPWEAVRDLLTTDRSRPALEAYQFVFGSRYARPAAALAEYALPSFFPGRPLLQAVLDLTARIHADFRYDPRATTLSTPLHEVFEKRHGVCQDFAHLQIACLRSLGLATRYVSGYIRTSPAPGQSRLVGADATHAWVSIYCPVHGWVDQDPTNNQTPSDKHLLLAWGRDYDDVSPVKGVILGGGQPELKVSVDVCPLEAEEEQSG